MCGIAGTVGTADTAIVGSMTDSLRHRGPDGTGFGGRGAVQVGMARLSIIDPGAGTDLISNENRTISIAFNGEIYNYRTLRAELERKGHVFTTNTDTEVVVHLYEEVGHECVSHLHGMFAFAVLEANQVFLARDRLGIKPLHYTTIPGRGLFAFASEIKALLRCPGVSARLDLQAFADFVVMRHPVGAATFFQGIQSLQPGHSMTAMFGADGVAVSEPRSYHSTVFNRQSGVRIEDAAEELEGRLRATLTTHFDADVPVAVTLSGGIDSSLLALLVNEQSCHRLSTFTVADRPMHPDARQAALLAARLGSDHHEIVLGFDQYIEAIPGFVAAQEQPSSLSGLPFYVLSRHVAESARVMLHGEGADELFGGYREYLDPSFWLRDVGHRLRLLKRMGMQPSAQLLGLLERLTTASSEEERCQTMFEVNLADPLERHHLDLVDKCAMAFGVETRVPYLDDAVVELACRLPLDFLIRRDLGIHKYILRRLCLERYGLSVMDVVLRSKVGLPSAASALIGRFNSMCQHLLPERYLSQHELGYCFQTKYELLKFELFEDIFMRHHGDATLTCSVSEFLQIKSGLSTRDFRSAVGLL
jgi:asparagine synthase (glutamine-hydrolysing)